MVLCSLFRIVTPIQRLVHFPRCARMRSIRGRVHCTMTFIRREDMGIPMAVSDTTRWTRVGLASPSICVDACVDALTLIQRLWVLLRNG